MANKKYRRGYPVAILVGLEKDDASLWQVFSKVVKPIASIRLDGSRNDFKAVFNFHESIVNALRPTFKEGVRSVILASPLRTGYAQEFIHHVKKHHAWLVQGANEITFAEAAGSARTPSQVAALTRTETFQSLILGITSEETVNLLELLEKRSNPSTEVNAESPVGQRLTQLGGFVCLAQSK